MSLIHTNINLFDGFADASREDWQSQILSDLKAATAAEKKALYAQKMIWQTYEGIAVQPFYTLEDIPPVDLPFPEKKHASWQNRENIIYSTEKEANTWAIEAMHSGAEAITFDLSSTQIGAVNYSKLLQQLKPSETPVSFKVSALTKDFIPGLKKTFPYHWKGSLQFDPLAQYFIHGKSITPTDYGMLAEAITQTARFPEFYALTVNSHHIHEAGASAVQELALLLATFVEYADQLTEHGISVTDILNTTQFSVAVSTNYFVEIAKCRSLRLLIAQLAEIYGVKEYNTIIHAQTALWNKPSADAYINIIRSTIEAMAAITGGCDAITVAPYTIAFAENSAFARRIARNISTILKEESYFDKVLNIASGAYYIEHLTFAFAQEAWQLFQTIESKGGIISAFNSGFIHDMIEKVRLQKEADLHSGKQVLVGVNKYQVQDEPAMQKEYFKQLFHKPGEEN